jgi:hypothetical protein
MALWYDILFDEIGAKPMCAAVLRALFFKFIWIAYSSEMYRPVEPGAAKLAAPVGLVPWREE